ncbi:MAG: hypothetical protein GY856_46320 [bacterium]|nr:hypothetical protein [bacterium]
MPNVEAADEGVSKDKLFKTALRYFLDNLVELIDPELAATLDLANPDFLPPEVFKDFQKYGHAIPDVAARVRTREGKPRLLTLHVEVEGEFSAAMDERMKYYSMHLELEFRQPVIAIAVFLQGGPKGVKFRKVRTKVGKWEFSSFGYLAFGLSRSLAEEYVDRPQPLAPALAARMRSRLWDKAEKKLRCLLAVHRAELPLKREYVLARIVETQIDLKPEEEERLAGLVVRHRPLP